MLKPSGRSNMPAQLSVKHSKTQALDTGHSDMKDIADKRCAKVPLWIDPKCLPLSTSMLLIQALKHRGTDKAISKLTRTQVTEVFFL